MNDRSKDRALRLMESADKPINMFYRGSSMRPTLSAPALLEIEPYQGRSIQCGDVIVFYPPQEEEPVAHRVVSLDDRGIKTRGDARNEPDLYVLTPQNVIGQVVYARAGKKRRRIHGGAVGRAIGRWLRIRAALGKGCSAPLRSVYHLLGRSGMFRVWLPARLRIRVLAFNRADGKELHLFMGKRLIGQLPVGETSWRIKPPYKLFVDELYLPRGDREDSPIVGNPAPQSGGGANSCDKAR